MKKFLIISTILIICLSFLAIAEADLIVENFDIRQDNPEARESYHYILDVKNIGDQAIETCLPAEIYFQHQPELKYPNCLLNTLAHPRQPGSEAAKVKIISENGEETQVTPQPEEMIYFTPALSPAEIEEEKQNFLEGRAQGLTEEEITKELEEIEIFWGQRQEHALDSYLITLQPGEILRFESDNSHDQIETITLPMAELSIEPILLTINIEVDRFMTIENENLENNLFSKEILIAPTVKQGPLPESSTNAELENENQYFAFAGGCTTVQNKEICVNLVDEDLDGEEDTLVISVDGSEEKYGLYGLFMAWMYQWFGDGRLAPAEVNNGVEIIVYKEGFKFTFV